MENSHSKIYLNIFLMLLGLTILTVVLARTITLSPAVSIVVALSIASVKAGLVIWYFMHMKHENKLIWMYATFPVIILIILIVGLFIDDPYRDSPKPVKVIEVK